VRHGLDDVSLIELFAWMKRHSRPGWLAARFIASATTMAAQYCRGIGNAPKSAEVVAALQARAGHPSALVREHVAWALVQLL